MKVETRSSEPLLPASEAEAGRKAAEAVAGSEATLPGAEPLAETSLEEAEKRYVQALAEVDEERNRIMDRHIESVAKYQKMLEEYRRKRAREEEIRAEEERSDQLNERALLERLEARRRLEERRG
jgi:hypothetical protein